MSRKPVVLISAVGLGFALTLGGCAAAPTPEVTPTPTVTDASAYTSDGFAVPFTVTVSDLVAPDPIDPNHEQVTWESPENSNDRIRVVAPVRVFPPGSDTAIDPPEDYAGYLEGLTAAGAVITDLSTVEADGNEVPIFTITGPDINGSLGCIANVEKDENDCFGVHPEYLLRLAVIPVGETTILAWARTDSTEPNLELFDSFEEMLATLHFTG